MKRYFLPVLITALLFISIALLAQPGDPGGEPGAPLDGGLLTILIGSGIVYLGKKYRDKHKKGNE